MTLLNLSVFRAAPKPQLRFRRIRMSGSFLPLKQRVTTCAYLRFQAY